MTDVVVPVLRRADFQGLDSGHQDLNRAVVKKQFEPFFGNTMRADATKKAFPTGICFGRLTLENVCPSISLQCGYLCSLGRLVPVECASDWVFNHGKKQKFFPKKRIICGKCSMVRYNQGEFSLCACISRMLEHCQEHGKAQRR